MTFLNTTFQESSPVISYVGEWLQINPIQDPETPLYSQKSAEVTPEAGAMATLTFSGTSITIFGAKRTNHGNYSISLDDGPPFIGNGTEDNIFQTPLWSAQNLANTQHTVVLTNMPTSQDNQWLDVDFVTIGREIGPPGYTGSISNMTLDDQSPFIEYNGSWSSLFSASALNSSLHTTAEEGSSLSLFFRGSSVELYGLYANAPFQIKLDDQLPRNLVGSDVNATRLEPQTLLFYADGLDENKTHAVTLTNTVANPDSPLHFDYAIVRGSQTFIEANPDSGSTATSATSTISTATDIADAPQSRPIPLGTIIGSVVGGVGGLVILAFIGFLFLRRSRFYHHSPGVSRLTDEGDVRPSFSTRNDGITPLVFPSPTKVANPSVQTPAGNSVTSQSSDSQTSNIPPSYQATQGSPSPRFRPSQAIIQESDGGPFM